MKKYIAIITLAMGSLAAHAQDPTADQLINYFEAQRIRGEIRHAARHSDDPAALYFAVTQQYRLEQQENSNRMLQLATEMYRQQE